jgi:hypothetical protein
VGESADAFKKLASPATVSRRLPTLGQWGMDKQTKRQILLFAIAVAVIAFAILTH